MAKSGHGGERPRRNHSKGLSNGTLEALMEGTRKGKEWAQGWSL